VRQHVLVTVEVQQILGDLELVLALARSGRLVQYIYTGEPLGDRKGYSLVKVDKATGKEAGRIWIDKQFPKYKIDLATETVFATEGNSRIFAIR